MPDTDGMSDAEGLGVGESSQGMDADAVGPNLYVRGWIRGDRFQPLGMKQTKKLQDFFVDSKVNKRERGTLPILVAPKGIAAVVGYRVAEWASVTPSTKRVLYILGRKSPVA